jgi:long-subunit acyl-CoA synthetase (AMP-forming)
MGKALSLDVQLTHVEPAIYESLIAFTGSETHTSNERAEISAIYYTSGTTGEPKGAC